MILHARCIRFHAQKIGASHMHSGDIYQLDILGDESDDSILRRVYRHYEHVSWVREHEVHNGVKDMLKIRDIKLGQPFEDNLDD